MKLLHIMSVYLAYAESFYESAIAGLASYGLETANGHARKPDSLYVEGRKPE